MYEINEDDLKDLNYALERFEDVCFEAEARERLENISELEYDTKPIEELWKELLENAED